MKTKMATPFLTVNSVWMGLEHLDMIEIPSQEAYGCMSKESFL